jgi:hypothetical protein
LYKYKAMLNDILDILGGNAFTYERIKSFGIINYNWRVNCDLVFGSTLSLAMRDGIIEKIVIPGNSHYLKGHLFAVVSSPATLAMPIVG